MIILALWKAILFLLMVILIGILTLIAALGIILAAACILDFTNAFRKAWKEHHDK